MFKKNIYDNKTKNPFKISRTKIDLFFDCKRCFFLDQKFGIRRPHGTPLVINNKIINNFKQELKECREQKKVHPKILKLNRNFIPLNSTKLFEWSNSFKGVRHLHKESNFLLYGIIDDIWYDSHNKKNHLVIIKTTSKDDTLNHNSIWPGYWRQLSFYSFLVQKNGIDTSKTGIFIYINTGKNSKDFSNVNISFNIDIFEKILDFSWIETTIVEIYQMLNNSKIPEKSHNCKFCKYYFNIKQIDE